MYLRSVKKLISPGVASLSDAAPVIFSAGSPTNLPSARSASSLIVKLIGKTVREGEFASQVKWLGADDRALRLFGALGGRALLRLAVIRQRFEPHFQRGGRFSINACTPSSAVSSIMLHAMI